MSMMFNPAYPAEILREEILPTLGLTVTAAAKQLGSYLSRLLHGVTGITPDMALRIEAWLGKERGGDVNTGCVCIKLRSMASTTKNACCCATCAC